MLGSVSFNIIVTCSAKRQLTTGRLQSVTLIMALDCCGRRSVSFWNHAFPAVNSTLGMIWSITFGQRWIRFGSLHLTLRHHATRLLLQLYPVTAEEARLLSSSLAKHCSLDLVPTWLLKHATEQLAPILAGLCNATFQARGLFVAKVCLLDSARLKKSVLDHADLNSYRPISQLSIVSKLVEWAIGNRFVQHCDEH